VQRSGDKTLGPNSGMPCAKQDAKQVRQTGRSATCHLPRRECTSHHGPTQYFVVSTYIERFVAYVCPHVTPTPICRSSVLAPVFHPATLASVAPLLRRMIRPRGIPLDATGIALDNDLLDRHRVHHQFGVSFSSLDLHRYVSYTSYQYPL